ncbi:hypothetical protein SCULI_v1c06170 [Spiroplasma culicicola AES-1]|uniref:HTH rpiR-type domain-containing protein n=2 Tax=Spiroplasma culicicola TaxID=216935 RepID=W6A742_9MOLU|nr:hypothetical protein SCULI_v1c06170 [Spiroplasma culicicola AES-1]
MISIYERIENVARQEENSSYKIIAKNILEDFRGGLFRTQKDLSDKCFVSMSTVTQFSKHLLLSGYRELVVRLKVEREKFNLALNNKKDEFYKETNQKRFELLKNIYEWSKKNEDWLSSIINEINVMRKVLIVASWQAKDVCDILSKLLQSKLIRVKFINNDADILALNNAATYKDWVKLCIISGRDNNTLINFYLKTLIKEKHSSNFLISSASQIDKVKTIPFDKTLILNYDNDDSSYARRTMAMHLIFHEIFESIK